MKTRNYPGVRLYAFLLCFLLLVLSARAATENWSGADAGTWSLSTNWSGNFTPVSTSDLTILGPGDVAGNLTINLDAASAANSINFTNTSGNATVLQGSGADRTLTLSSNGTAITTGTGAVTIGSGSAGTRVNIALGANQTWSVGSGNLTVKDVISGSSRSLTKSGSGTLTLKAQNTYTGGTFVTGGTLVLDGSAYGNPAAILAANSDLTISNATVSLIGQYNVINNQSGGTVTINQGGTLTAGTTGLGQSLYNVILNGGELAKVGAGFFYTFGLISATDNSTISADLQMQKSTPVEFNVSSGKTLLMSGNIRDGVTTSLTKNGTGTMVLSGANTYTGNTIISNGTLQIAKTSSLYNGNNANWTAAKIRVASGATLALNVGGTNEFSTGNVTTLLTNLGGANGTSTTGFAAGSSIAFDTTNASGGNFTVANNIADSTGSGGGAIGVTKLGTGNLILSGNNTYTGATTISAGTLLINGSTSTSSAVTVASGATLGGNGTVGGFTTVNGNLRPGNSPGVLTFSSGLTLNGTTTMEINGATTAGTDFDQVVVSSGTTTFGGALAFTFGTSLLDGNNILLFNFAGTSLGNFSGVTSTGSYSGTWSVGVANNTWTFNTGTQLLTFSEVTGNLNVVPEPATWALLAFSLTTVMVLRRRRC